MIDRKNKRFYWLLHLCKVLAWPSWWIIYHRRYHYMPNAFRRAKIKGPGIVICNHNHWIEPPLIAYTFPFRTIVFIISNVLSTNWFGKWFFNQIGTVVINKKEFEWNNFKKIIAMLKQGKLVLIFPEGIMNKSEQLVDFKEGLVTIAHLANVPIYPIYIANKHKPLRLQHIMLGETINLNQKYQQLNTQTCSAMTKLLWEYINIMKHQLESELHR